MQGKDVKLGMGRDITRRDFIHDISLGALALSLPGSLLAAGMPPPAAGTYYPPTLTGLRGAHPGAFEVAHALAREGKAFSDPQLLDESYDLVVVGAGISGLAAARYLGSE
jgi:spermidine dehydrogenase